METRANHFVVGLFVLLTVAALGVFSVWIVNRSASSEQAFYDIGFTGSVAGLQVGSAVRYRGIPVGTVADVRIDPSDVEVVLVTVTVRPGTPIKDDTVASVDTNPLTGLSTIQLDGGTQASPLLVAKGGMGNPRIRSVRSALEAVFRSTPQLLESVAAMVERISQLLSDENLGRIERTLTGIENLTVSLESRRDRLTGLLDQSATTVSELTGAATEFKQLAAELRTTVGTLGPAATTGLVQLGEASSSLQQLSRRLDRMAEGLSGPLADFSRRGLGNAGALVTELRDLSATLNRILREFERDPAGYLLGGQKGFTPP